MSKYKRVEGFEEAQAFLRDRWPLMFDYISFKPLALGAGDEILAAAEEVGVTRAAITAAIRHYVSRKRYVANVARYDSVRTNLDGSVAEPVSDEHRNGAYVRLQSMLRDKHKRKVEEQAAQALAAMRPENDVAGDAPGGVSHIAMLVETPTEQAIPTPERKVISLKGKTISLPEAPATVSVKTRARETRTIVVQTKRSRSY